MNVVITGVSSGIGRELVKLFDKQGNQVVGLSRNKEKLNTLAQECSSEVELLVGDIVLDETLEKLKKIINNWESVDIVVNNAGLLINKNFEELNDDDFIQVYKTNVLAPVKLIQTLIKPLKKSTLAHVVNISSMGGFQGSSKFPGLSYYSSSKAAIASITECLAEEYKETTVRFNSLALGAVQTEMLTKAFPGYEANTSAFEMANYIYDFAINGSKMFNGKILPVSNSTP